MPKAGKEDVRQLIRAQRDALGDLLESLSDAEWDLASLCTGWRVRDVVAHCVQSHVATPWTFASEWIASGFSLKVRNERWVARRRPRSRSEVIDEYRATAVRLAIPAAETPYALVEAVIHGYDIAWPLRRTIEVPATSLVVVADTCRRTNPFLHSKQRCAGLALRASDISWSAGSGPQVAGPLASIIMAITGRPAALDDLSGKGLDTLRSRL